MRSPPCRSCPAGGGPARHLGAAQLPAGGRAGRQRHKEAALRRRVHRLLPIRRHGARARGPPGLRAPGGHLLRECGWPFTALCRAAGTLLLRCHACSAAYPLPGKPQPKPAPTPSSLPFPVSSSRAGGGGGAAHLPAELHAGSRDAAAPRGAPADAAPDARAAERGAQPAQRRQARRPAAHRHRSVLLLAGARAGPGPGAERGRGECAAPGAPARLRGAQPVLCLWCLQAACLRRVRAWGMHTCAWLSQFSTWPACPPTHPHNHPPCRWSAMRYHCWRSWWQPTTPSGARQRRRWPLRPEPRVGPRPQLGCTSRARWSAASSWERRG